jgi:hypothetical protein
MKNGNQTDVSPPTTSLMLNNKEEVRTYSEQNSFDNGCLQIGMILLIVSIYKTAKKRKKYSVIYDINRH